MFVWYVISVLVVLVLVVCGTGWREALLRARYYFRLWRNGGGSNGPVQGLLPQD